MVAWFGPLWTEHHGRHPSPHWVHELERHTPQEVAAALELLKKEGGQYPPSLPHFFSLVEQAKGKDQFVRPKAFKRALPEPPGQLATRRRSAKVHVKELLETIKAKAEATNASREQQATAVHGDVQKPQDPQASQEEVSTG